MDVPQIIKALGGPAAVAAHLGIPSSNTVSYWAHRRRIPPRHWLSLSRMPAAGPAGVTLDVLDAAAAASAQPGEAAEMAVDYCGRGGA